MAVRQLVRLNTGLWMPTLGLGTYLAQSGIQEAVDVALHTGYRHIDTAASYGNEVEVGAVLREALSQQRLRRKDLFITTKVPPVYLHPDDLVLSAEQSLSRLGLTYIDMLLIHSPFGRKNHKDGNLFPTDSVGNPDHFHHDLNAAWSALEGLVDRGLTKAIGISNFSPSQIQRIVTHARIQPANLQLECHCYYQQVALRAFCRKHGIVITAYSPLGARGRPDRHRHEGDQDALSDPVVANIVTKRGRTPAQVLLRYLLQLGVVPLPKSTNPDRIQENFKVYDFQLDSSDMTQLARLNTDHKFFRFLADMTHPEYPVNELF